MKQNTEPIAFRATPELLSEIKEIAKSENRTRANMILCLVKEALEYREK